MTVPDIWAEWVLHRRDGGDPALRDISLRRLSEWRDLVLDGARLRPSDHVLDVGTGDGLIGFGALHRLDPMGRVTFSDVSEDLLGVCRARAGELDLLDRCEFVAAAASDLSPIADASVDVVTTRSVLIYEARKDRAFAEFHRVLRPGGRISLFEPINRFMVEPSGEFLGYSASGVEDLVAKVRAGSCSAAEGPMLDFDDATLVELAERAGLSRIEAVLRRRVAVGTVSMPWDRFLASSPNPLAPSWGDAIAGALTRSEQERLSEVMSPRLRDGRQTVREALVTLTAERR